MLTDKQLKLHLALRDLDALRHSFYLVVCMLAASIAGCLKYREIFSIRLIALAITASLVVQACVGINLLRNLRVYRAKYRRLHDELLRTDVQVQMSNALHEAAIKRTMFHCVCAILAILLVILPILGAVLGVKILIFPALVLIVPALEVIEKQYAELNAKDREIQSKYASVHPFFSP